MLLPLSGYVSKFGAPCRHCQAVTGWVGLSAAQERDLRRAEVRINCASSRVC